VETAEARDKLLELGCHLAQGYYFSKPVPADDIPFGSVLPA
jgi:EAL domain-containing protein (putative c-di-GMP-specific phosphodiesterase class I)